MNPAPKKTFVLDTNVILHDCTCVSRFEEHDVVLPVTVLEELDRFKKGNEAVHHQARQFVRFLDNLSADGIFREGIEVSPRGGRLTIALGRETHPDLGRNFADPKPDHRILNTTYHLAQDLGTANVALVTKDVNLRMKARALGLTAEDYTSDHVRDVSDLYTGRRIVENVPGDVIRRIYQDPCCADPAPLDLAEPLRPNEFLILRNHEQSALATLDPEGPVIRRVEKRTVYRITPRNAEQTFALDALMNPAIPLVTLTGKAGTGKTLLALSAALEMQRRYRFICVARPVVPLSNRDLGFLPGDLESKLDPYMQPLYDNLNFIQSQYPESDRQHRWISDALANGRLTITPLSYIRGRSLVKTFFIVDEAQNLTPHEVKTVITRAGEGTKIVFTGDIMQIDHPYLDSHSNGLSHLIAKMKGQSLYAHVTLEKGERSHLAGLASDLL